MFFVFVIVWNLILLSTAEENSMHETNATVSTTEEPAYNFTLPPTDIDSIWKINMTETTTATSTAPPEFSIVIPSSMLDHLKIATIVIPFTIILLCIALRCFPSRREKKWTGRSRDERDSYDTWYIEDREGYSTPEYHYEMDSPPSQLPMLPGMRPRPPAPPQYPPPPTPVENIDKERQRGLASGNIPMIDDQTEGNTEPWTSSGETMMTSLSSD